MLKWLSKILGGKGEKYFVVVFSFFFFFFLVFHSKYICGITSRLKIISSEGLMEVNMTEVPMEVIEMKFSKFFGVEFGGQWKPKDCRPRWKVGFTSLVIVYCKD